MSQALRKLTAAVNKSNCTIVFINQIREKVGVKSLINIAVLKQDSQKF